MNYIARGTTQSLLSVTITWHIIEHQMHQNNSIRQRTIKKENKKERTWQAHLDAVLECPSMGSYPLLRWLHDQWRDDCMVEGICIETRQSPGRSSRRDSTEPTSRYQLWASVASCSTRVYVQWCPNCYIKIERTDGGLEEERKCKVKRKYQRCVIELPTTKKNDQRQDLIYCDMYMTLPF